MKEWSATLTGDYLWTNMIVAEVFPTTITPSTWSVWQDYFDMLSMGDVPTIQLIAGRPYLNYSLTYSFLLKIMRKHERVVGLVKDSIGLPPAGVDIPPFPISWLNTLPKVLLREARNESKKARLRKIAPEFLVKVRERCRELMHRIEPASGDELIALWTQEIRPLWKELHPLQDKMNEDLNRLTQRLKTESIKLLGDEDASMLLTTISGGEELASLGPLVGLSKLRKGELSREEYLRQYGHRGPHENELAEPRPYEDPDWLDAQLAEFEKAPVDVQALMDKRDAESSASRAEMARHLPLKTARDMGHKVDEIVEANTLREATRSELTRVVGVVRALFLRAGELTGLRDGVFFLTIDELVAALSGDMSAAAHIPARREAYAQYRALPPLPPWIRGRFDPLQWAADPDRRKDVFDEGAPVASSPLSVSRIIQGHPGSAGQVEGVVRCIASVDEGDQLQPGEILVATTTNVGWTPLFPRAAAVITDVGGSLSHAAIVARELGIPAVVGCVDATARLRTGDRVRVNGSKGTVEILGARKE